ncbi:MAG: hemerythrin domain-containing protein [Bacteroidales bacterium]|nr:hemerythrin domain-containing protein [Bacteroides sp.]MCM1198067.1 hemerythrin domain-containing protein [Clostridium sp.]MCM1502467.1 hemerythrin domain-containing protein [Bacteroidales bacterium]
MKHTESITPSMKLADLISLNYKLLEVLSRLDIGLGFGEGSIADACVSHGIDINSFLLICNEYTFDGYVASVDQLSNGSPTDIMKYLHNSHVCYMDKEMTKLESLLHTLMEPTGEAHGKMLYRFFNEYKDEVRKHFEYEEETVFPYIRSLIGRKATDGYSMEKFEENHTNIDEKLGDLKNIVMKYLPESCDPMLRNDALYHIFRLEEDLYRHTLIEDHVLVPMVTILEGHEQ